MLALRRSLSRYRERFFQSRLGQPFSGRVAKGLTALTGASVIGQAVVFATSPFLSRIYTPEQFGGFGLVVSWSLILGYVFTLRMEAAITIPKDPAESRAILRLAIRTTLAMGILTLVTTLLLSHFTNLGGSIRTVPLWQWGLPILATLTAVLACVSQYGIKLHVYQVVARVSVLQALSAGAAQIVLGLFTGVGLVFGAIVGKLVGIPTLARATGLLHRNVTRPKFSGKELYRTYWRFPVLFMPAGLVNIAGGQLAILAFPILYGLEVTGQYAMANRLLGIPATLFGLAVGSVFLGELARVRHEGGDRALRMFHKWTRVLVIPAALMVVFVLLLGKPLTILFLGPQWGPAADYLVILVWGIAAAFVAGPLDHVWTVYQKAAVSMIWQTSRFAGMLAIFWWANTKSWPVERTLIAVSAWTFLSYTASWFSCWRILKRSKSETTSDFIDLDRNPMIRPPEDNLGATSA